MTIFLFWPLLAGFFDKIIGGFNQLKPAGQLAGRLKLLTLVVSQGSWRHRSYIKDITITFISEKEFFIFIVFYPPKTQSLFSSILANGCRPLLNVRVSFRQAPQENRHRASLILEGKFKIAIEQKKKLSFRVAKHNKNEKFFFRDEYYCNICDISSV